MWGQRNKIDPDGWKKPPASCPYFLEDLQLTVALKAGGLDQSSKAARLPKTIRPPEFLDLNIHLKPSPMGGPSKDWFF
jgi:hypothetical protein